MKSWLDRLHPYRWWFWSLFAAAWTIALVFPKPQEAMGVEDWSDSAQFWTGKSLHLIAYAFFAILSGWLKVRPSRRWILMFALMAHAGVTEWLQPYMGRTGMLADVVRNYAGIAAGVALSWRWWWDEN